MGDSCSGLQGMLCSSGHAVMMLHALLILHPQARASAAGGPNNDGPGSSHTLLDGNSFNSSAGGSSPGRLNSLFKGGLFKGAATISLSSTDDDRVAADDAAGQVLMPKHWEEQIKTAPLGRRRVMRRWGQHITQWTVAHNTLYQQTDCWHLHRSSVTST